MKKTIVKESDIFFFSEEKYIRDKEADFDDSKKALLRTPPSLANIEEFINAIYDCTHFRCFIFKRKHYFKPDCLVLNASLLV